MSCIPGAVDLKILTIKQLSCSCTVGANHSITDRRNVTELYRHPRTNTSIVRCYCKHLYLLNLIDNVYRKVSSIEEAKEIIAMVKPRSDKSIWDTMTAYLSSWIPEYDLNLHAMGGLSRLSH
jgi:hypothetical protein